VNLNQLKLFYLAVKRKNLSIAARELHITQPAVTKGIQRLQEHYEVKLMHRLGKNLALTPAGQALFEIAEKIFEMEKQAEDCLQDYRRRETVKLRIHASESFGAYYLPEVINRFNQSNPKIQVILDIMPNSQVVENTLGLKNDLGFVSHPVQHNKLVVREVLEDKLVIIVPPDHQLAGGEVVVPRDLADQVMIMHEAGSVIQDVLHNLMADHHISFSMPVTFSNNEAIKRAVEGGTGIALISRKVAEEEIRTGRLMTVPLDAPSMFRKFYMIHHREKHIFSPMQRFLDLIFQWASEFVHGA